MKRLGARGPGTGVLSRLAASGRSAARRSPTAVGLAAALLFAACGGSGDEADSGEAAGAGEDAAGVTVVDPWVRVAVGPAGGDPDAPSANTAAYFVLVNATDAADALAAVASEVADTAEIHSVTMDEGVARMRPVDSVAVPAGGRAVLEPGDYHIMLIGIREALAEGDSVDLRLTLRSGRAIDVRAPVRRSPP